MFKYQHQRWRIITIINYFSLFILLHKLFTRIHKWIKESSLEMTHIWTPRLIGLDPNYGLSSAELHSICNTCLDIITYKKSLSWVIIANNLKKEKKKKKKNIIRSNNMFYIDQSAAINHLLHQILGRSCMQKTLNTSQVELMSQKISYRFESMKN